MWDAETRKLLHTYYENSDVVHCVRYAPASHCLASCCEDGDINVWDTRSNQLVQHYREHEAAVNSIRFHPNGNYLISASTDKSLKVMDLREGHLLYTLQGHTGAANAVGFSADGQYFASGSSDEIVMVWKTNFDRPERALNANATSNAEAKTASESKSSSKPGSKQRRVKSKSFKSKTKKTAPLRPRNTTKPVGKPSKIQIRKTQQLSSNHPSAPSTTTSAPMPPSRKVNNSQSSVDARSVAKTMDVVAQQLKVTLDTLGVFERRLRRNEDAISEIATTQKQIVELLRNQQQKN